MKTPESMAEWFVANLIPVVPTQPIGADGAKRPVLHPDGHPWEIAEPEDVHIIYEQARRKYGAEVGVSIRTWPVSSIIVVDIDANPVPLEVTDWLNQHGVTRDLEAWWCKSPRGGLKGHFYWPTEWAETPAKRMVHVDGLPIDLLVKGQSHVPPTKGYEWLPNRSPADIPVGALAEVPSMLKLKMISDGNAQQDQNGAPDHSWIAKLFQTPIPEGQRNDGLARVMGTIHNKLPYPDAVALLHQVNQACCTPPLPKHEVELIARSIGARKGFTRSDRPSVGAGMEVRWI